MTVEQKQGVGRRLGKLADVAARYCINERTALRMADTGRIPWGLKIGRLRRWDMDVIDEHIRDGCPAVTRINEASRKRHNAECISGEQGGSPQ